MPGWTCGGTTDPVDIDTLIGRRLRPAVVVGGIVPMLLLTWRLLHDGLGANPAEALEHSTGFTALWFLLASLSCTPLRRITGRAAFTRLRKPLGLWAFAYALMHLGCYLVFDQSLLFGEIWYDIRKRVATTQAPRPIAAAPQWPDAAPQAVGRPLDLLPPPTAPPLA